MMYRNGMLCTLVGGRQSEARMPPSCFMLTATPSTASRSPSLVERGFCGRTKPGYAFAPLFMNMATYVAAPALIYVGLELVLRFRKFDRKKIVLFIFTSYTDFQLSIGGKAQSQPMECK